MSELRNELIERYIRTCWIIKLRLMSSRRQLWCGNTSLIHHENSCLQIRKICEGIAQLCLIAGHVEYSDIPKKIRKSYEVGKIFNHLDSIDRLKFLIRARLDLQESNTTRRVWSLNVNNNEKDEDRKRVVSIFSRCGNMLHERSAFSPFPAKIDDAVNVLIHNRNGIRSDHQWLWNFLWQHVIEFTDSPVFMVNFGENDDVGRPSITYHQGFIAEEINVEMTPDFVADFERPIDWTEFDEESAKQEHAET